MSDANGTAAVTVTGAPVAPAGEKERFRMVGDVGPLFAALALAVVDFGPIERTKEADVVPKDASKRGYKFSYAPQENLIAATRSPLAKQSLVIIQPFHSTPGGWLLRTILAHSSGAYIEAIDFIASYDRITNQDLGGTITFRRRYGYAAILSLAAEDDDDANAADGNAATFSSRKRAADRPPSATPTPANAAKPASGQVAKANLSFPAGWPNSEPATIMRWLDAIEVNLPKWKWALATLKSNQPLYDSPSDWPVVLTHVANRLRTLIVEKKLDAADAFFTATVPEEIKRMAAMVPTASAQEATPPTGTDSHEPANQPR